MLYGGLRLRDTESIQANTNSQVFMGTTRIRQQWFPGRFFSNRKRPRYEASLLVEPEWKNHDIKRGGYTTYFLNSATLFSILAKCVSMCTERCFGSKFATGAQ